MLVLSRRPGQSILIGHDIEIVLLATDGLNIRVGVRAPREVTVLRRELVEQVGAENRRAAAVEGRERFSSMTTALLELLRAAPPEPPDEAGRPPSMPPTD